MLDGSDSSVFVVNSLAIIKPFRFLFVFLGTPKIVKPEKPIDGEVIPCLLEPVTCRISSISPIDLESASTETDSKQGC